MHIKKLMTAGLHCAASNGTSTSGSRRSDFAPDTCTRRVIAGQRRAAAGRRNSHTQQNTSKHALVVLCTALCIRWCSAVRPGAAAGAAAHRRSLVGSRRAVMSVEAGDFHTCLVLDINQMLCFGDNEDGRLGLDSSDSSRGTAPGDTAASMVKLPSDTTVTSVSAGAYHTCLVLDNGDALCFGDNSSGRLGLDLPSSTSRGTAPGETVGSVVQVPSSRTVTSVAAGAVHTCVVLDNHDALCFGNNFNGQLGLDSFDSSRGTAPGETAGSVVKVPSGRHVEFMSAGDEHTCAVLDNGDALCFGFNGGGRLGLDSPDSNRGGALGDTAASIVQVPSNRSVVSVSAGGRHTCLVLDNGDALCFGDNQSGQLGLDSPDASRGRAAGETATSIVQVPSGRSVASVSAGFFHTCVVLNNGQALCFGTNGESQLGLDIADSSSRGDAVGETAASIVQVPSDRSVTSVSAGRFHTCVVLDNGDALCFGDNSKGQLGLDSTDSSRGRAVGETAASIVQILPPPTPSPSPSPSVSPTQSATHTPSVSSTPSWSPTGTPSVSSTPSWSPTGTPSSSPSGTPSWSPTGTPSVSSTPSWSPTATPSSSPSGTPSWSPTGTPSVSSTPSWSPTGTPSSSPSGTPSWSPTGTPSSSPSSTPSWSPTGTPSPSQSQSQAPVADPFGTASTGGDDDDDDDSLPAGPIAAVTLVAATAAGAAYIRFRSSRRHSARRVPPPAPAAGGHDTV